MDSLRHFRLPTALSGLLLLSLPVRALKRTIGVSSDIRTQETFQNCIQGSNNTYHVDFEYGSCPNLIACMMNNLPADLTAGMQAGGNIASLVPTILALVGAPPLNLVQLSFMSPHRAIATCMFGIGLPSGLFRQLQVRLPTLADKKINEPQKREWVVPVLKSKRKGRLEPVKTIVVDVLIIALAGVMVWRNTVVCFQTMVTWRCEYSWLLVCWPVACVVWLMIAVALLHVFAKRIEITYSEDSTNTRRSRLDLLLLPYRTPHVVRESRNSMDKKVPLPESHVSESDDLVIEGSPNVSPHSPVRSVSSQVLLEPHFVITITMRHENHWGWFEAAIETLAVGVYLYATFVLTSSLFLSGEQAIIYATVMVLSLGAIRVFEAL